MRERGEINKVYSKTNHKFDKMWYAGLSKDIELVPNPKHHTYSISQSLISESKVFSSLTLSTLVLFSSKSISTIWNRKDSLDMCVDSWILLGISLQLWLSVSLPMDIWHPNKNVYTGFLEIKQLNVSFFCFAIFRWNGLVFKVVIIMCFVLILHSH